MSDCKYEPVERMGLYIMIIFLFVLGPCTKILDHNNTVEKIEEVKQIVLNIEKVVNKERR